MRKYTLNTQSKFKLYTNSILNFQPMKTQPGPKNNQYPLILHYGSKFNTCWHSQMLFLRECVNEIVVPLSLGVKPIYCSTSLSVLYSVGARLYQAKPKKKKRRKSSKGYCFLFYLYHCWTPHFVPPCSPPTFVLSTASSPLFSPAVTPRRRCSRDSDDPRLCPDIINPPPPPQ